MARVMQPLPEEESGWKSWVALSYPEPVRKVAEQIDPWSLYRMASTGYRVLLRGFDVQDDGKVTVRVVVLGDFNRVATAHEIWGVAPDDLSPCDPPKDDELVGDTGKPVDAMHVDELRLRMHPDLWVRDADGKVVRKS